MAGPGELELLLQALLTPNGRQIPPIAMVLLLGIENLQQVQDGTSTFALSSGNDNNLCLGLAEVG